MKAFRHVLTIAISVSILGLAGMAVAQPAVPADDDADTTSPKSLMDTISEVFGEGGVELNTSKEGGIDQFTDEQGDVVSVVAQDKVVLKSEKLNLNSDYLLIDAKGQKVIARGNVYLIIQDRTAICGLFEYDIATKRSILRDNPRIIGAADSASSSDIDVESCEIIIEEDSTGRMNTLFRGCDQKKTLLKIGGKPEETPAPGKPGNGATAIDPNNPSDVGQIVGGKKEQANTPDIGTMPTIPVP